MILAVAIVVACGAAFRVRGGWILPDGTTALGRAVWAFTAAAACSLVVGSPWPLSTAPWWYAGAIPAWWSSIDLGRNEGRWWPDAWRQALRGVIFTVPGAIGLAILQLTGTIDVPFAWIGMVAAAGMFALVCYELGWRLHGRWGIEATAFGEVATGACIGATIAAEVLWTTRLGGGF